MGEKHVLPSSYRVAGHVETIKPHRRLRRCRREPLLDGEHTAGILIQLSEAFAFCGVKPDARMLSELDGSGAEKLSLRFGTLGNTDLGQKPVHDRLALLLGQAGDELTGRDLYPIVMVKDFLHGQRGSPHSSSIIWRYGESAGMRGGCSMVPSGWKLERLIRKVPADQGRSLSSLLRPGAGPQCLGPLVEDEPQADPEAAAGEGEDVVKPGESLAAFLGVTSLDVNKL